MFLVVLIILLLKMLTLFKTVYKHIHPKFMSVPNCKYKCKGKATYYSSVVYSVLQFLTIQNLQQIQAYSIQVCIMSQLFCFKQGKGIVLNWCVTQS